MTGHKKLGQFKKKKKSLEAKVYLDRYGVMAPS
jgi:hypothetical protein